MKVFLASAFSFLTINVACTDNRHEIHYGENHGDGGRWLGPALLGGFIGYELARLSTIYA